MRLWAFLCVLVAWPSVSYRYLCNSIDAQGNVWGDEHSPKLGCTAASAPRWPGSSMQFYLDMEGLPNGIDSDTWLSLVQGVLEDWQATPNASLALRSSVGSQRSFGTDASSHDVFWVRDRDEWMSLIGAGPEGILGVTLPVYSVAQGSSVRILEDADMVLNACPELGIVWDPNCTNLADCFAPQATFSHEFGHVLGLGHPCVACEQLMSAQAVFMVDKPGFDEQSAIRMLYPGTTPGVLGDSCSGHHRCQSEFECRTVDAQQYCSKPCATDSECSGSLMVCDSGFCSFQTRSSLSSHLAEDCSWRKCAVGLLCVTNSSGSSLCYTDCSTGSGCTDTEVCYPLKDNQSHPVHESACIETASLASSFNSGSLSTARQQSGCNASNGAFHLWFFALILLIGVPRIRKKC
ncbi:MAG: hypothetical protein I8H75_01925 [Myxococcaceae bacterium]|nr:hypothetical protein [Myxococcaceae bacterium]MBH2006095.1 hypothetical protein [Myxococcaceae bacterium]